MKEARQSRDLPEECRHCGRAFVELRKHEKKCGQGEQDPNRLSNKEFIAEYKERLSSDGKRPKTVEAYITALRKIIKFEEKEDPDFRAQHWLLHPDHVTFRSLRPCSQYEPDKYSASVNSHIAMMWRHLHQFVEDQLADHTMSAMDRHRRLLGDHKNFTKRIKRGAFPTRKRKETNKGEDESDSQSSDEEGKRIDPKLTERIRQAYLDSTLRYQALRCPLDVVGEDTEKVFLAT